MHPRRWLLAIVIVCTAGLPTHGAEAAKPAKPVSVTFYHTSDLHEHSMYLPRVARLVAERRKTDPNVLFVDSGDWMNKGDLTGLKTRGEAIVAMMGAARYDAVIPGNHDFTFGAPRLADLVEKYSLPMLAANWRWSKATRRKGPLPYSIHKLRGVTVAVIGTAPPFAGDEKGPSVTIGPIAQAVRDILPEVEKKADVIVLLTHVGPPADKELIRALPRVDILFGGHHHKRFTSLHFDKTAQTVLQHSGCFGQTLGEVVIQWDGETITDRKARLITITRTMSPSAAVQAVADKYVPRKAPASQPPR